uniref:Uncharacterized protein n=1 Tax=uncultured marine microorganism HF4000_APKG8K5 TaxID=455555 RepID=B3TB29_9ZZZZ|nr:hypothetical protein ALOHA_HF4000APKG8K5ctg1g7 [uncultured marine microorganism HF4000_APKG8K5]
MERDKGGRFPGVKSDDSDLRRFRSWKSYYGDFQSGHASGYSARPR